MLLDARADTAPSDQVAVPVPDGELWWTLGSNEEVYSKAETSPAGLSVAEAAARLAKYGPNLLTPPQKPGG